MITNLQTMPQAGNGGGGAYGAATNGWGTLPTVTNNATGGPYNNGAYKRYTATSAFTPGASGVIMLQQLAVPGVTPTCSMAANPGETYNISMWVRSSIAQTFQPQLVYLNAAGAAANFIAGSDVTIPTNVWTRLSVQGTAAASTVGLRVDLRAGGGTRIPFAINDTVDVANVQITAGPTLYEYFDGSIYGNKWNGTANASTSSSLDLYLTRNLVVSNPHCSALSGTIAISSGRFGTSHAQTAQATGGPDGGGFQRYTATGTANTPVTTQDLINVTPGGSFGSPPVGGATCYVLPLTTYTISYYVRCSVAQRVRPNIQFIKYANNGSVLGSNGTGAQIGPDVTLVPNVWTRLSTTATSAVDTAALRVDVDMASAGVIPWGAAGDTFDFSMVLVQEGSTLNPYFDGNSADSRNAYAWTGPVGNSQSTQMPTAIRLASVAPTKFYLGTQQVKMFYGPDRFA